MGMCRSLLARMPSRPESSKLHGTALKGIPLVCDYCMRRTNYTNDRFNPNIYSTWAPHHQRGTIRQWRVHGANPQCWISPGSAIFANGFGVATTIDYYTGFRNIPHYTGTFIHSLPHFLPHSHVCHSWVHMPLVLHSWHFCVTRFLYLSDFHLFNWSRLGPLPCFALNWKFIFNVMSLAGSQAEVSRRLT